MLARKQNLLDKSRKVLERVVAVLVIIELIIFVLSFFSEWRDYFGFIGFLLENREPITYVTLSTVFVLVILLISHLYASQNQALQRQIEILSMQLERHRQCGDQFRAMARENAECDRAIFHRLFVEMRNAPEATQKAQIDLAVIEGVNNVNVILNCIADTFTLTTGNQCAACIQIIQHIPDRNKGDAIIQTLARDRLSESLRGKPPGQPVRENSIHMSIFIDGEDMVAIDNLENDRNFETSSANWRRFYDAVLVIAIPPMAGSTEGSTPRATLCVDNRGGGLKDVFCIALAREFAWRLAVKLYRLDELERAQSSGGTASA